MEISLPKCKDVQTPHVPATSQNDQPPKVVDTFGADTFTSSQLDLMTKCGTRSDFGPAMNC